MNIAIIISNIAKRQYKCYNNSNITETGRAKMQEYLWETPSEINANLAKRVKLIRKRKKITQKELADRSNVSYGALKKFEQTGEISLTSLTKIALELGLVSEIKNLFMNVPYNSIEEVLNEQKNT